MAKRWTLEDIPWDKFDRTKVDPETMAIVKAASMVEHNSGDYGAYLGRVFHDDPEFQSAASGWSEEEVQHGLALRRWAELADSDFDFDKAFGNFRDAYHAEDGFGLAADLAESNRGSRSRELIYRCVVETATSSFYSALYDSVDEPVLKEICRNIATDEIHHYKLFYRNLKHYRDLDRLSGLSRLTSTFRCVTEYSDDIVAYAYFAANDVAGPYDRKAFSDAYERRAVRLYGPSQADRIVRLIFQAAGLNHRGRLARWSAQGLYGTMRLRSRILHHRAGRRAKAAESEARALAY